MRRLVAALVAVVAVALPSAAQAAVDEYALPEGSRPLGLARAPDGAMWVLESGRASIARVAEDGTVAHVPAPGWTILTDATVADGNLWFTDAGSDRLGRAAAGETLGPIGAWDFGSSCDPAGVATAPDGAVWFVKPGCNMVGRVDPASAPNSSHDDFPVPVGTEPMRIAAGPDGAMWFTAHGTGRIGRVAADGTITYPVPGRLDAPYDLVTGPDGNLWATERGAGAILRITPAGEVTRFTAGVPAGARPEGIAAGADGHLYAAAPGADAILRISVSGSIGLIGLRAGAGPREVAAAEDGAVWFSASAGDWVGRWTPDPESPPAVAPPPAPPAPAAPAPPALAPPEPEPRLGKTVVAEPTRGKVRVTLPGSRRAYVLRSADDIPLGSTIDVRHGRLAVTAALPGGATQSGNFWGGFFKVRQSGKRSHRGVTTLELRSNLTCSTQATAAGSKARKKKRRRNTLWGSDRRGKFRTRGRNATATVRGTVWRTTDTCAGTVVFVASGAVAVRDSARKRTVTVRRGHRYVARDPR